MFYYEFSDSFLQQKRTNIIDPSGNVSFVEMKSCQWQAQCLVLRCADKCSDQSKTNRTLTEYFAFIA